MSTLSHFKKIYLKKKIRNKVGFKEKKNTESAFRITYNAGKSECKLEKKNL